MSELTHVELTCLEKRIENLISSGRAAEEHVIDRQRRVVSFAAASIIVASVGASNDYGAIAPRIDILRAVDRTGVTRWCLMHLARACCVSPSLPSSWRSHVEPSDAGLLWNASGSVPSRLYSVNLADYLVVRNLVVVMLLRPYSRRAVACRSACRRSTVSLPRPGRILHTHLLTAAVENWLSDCNPTDGLNACALCSQ